MGARLSVLLMNNTFRLFQGSHAIFEFRNSILAAPGWDL